MYLQVKTKQPLNILRSPKGISTVNDLALSSQRERGNWAYWFIQELRSQRDELPLVILCSTQSRTGSVPCTIPCRLHVSACLGTHGPQGTLI